MGSSQMIYFGILATSHDTASLRFIWIAVTMQIKKKHINALFSHWQFSNVMKNQFYRKNLMQNFYALVVALNPMSTFQKYIIL